MATDPRTALSQLIAAFERHFDAVSRKRGDEDSTTEQAYYQLEDAFLNYEEALSAEHGEFLPFTLAEEDQ
ncbi:MAG: primosomal protein [Rhodoluna sp.]